MGYKLKRFRTSDGGTLEEKACDAYVCRSCGSRMLSVNVVNGIRIQVFTTHALDCDFAPANPYQRTHEVTCESCRFYQNGTCTNEGPTDTATGDALTNVDVERYDWKGTGKG